MKNRGEVKEGITKVSPLIQLCLHDKSLQELGRFIGLGQGSVNVLLALLIYAILHKELS